MYCQATGLADVVNDRYKPREEAMTLGETSARRRDGPPGKTKAARIAEALRDGIATGAIAQGTRLHQDELAAQFSTSITPVREALRQLQAEGLLEGESHRGVTVASPDLEQIKSIYVLRRLIEPYAARRAALRLSRQDFARAEEINDELLQAQAAGDALRSRRLNHDFHFVFYMACGLPTVIAEIERLWATFPWSELQLHVVRGRESVREHASILEAMIAADEPSIQERFESHLMNGYLALVEHLGHTDRSDPFAIASG
jgi:DNA-binding GntR family transcriptional regulator